MLPALLEIHGVASGEVRGLALCRSPGKRGRLPGTSGQARTLARRPNAPSFSSSLLSPRRRPSREEQIEENLLTFCFPLPPLMVDYYFYGGTDSLTIDGGKQ